MDQLSKIFLVIKTLKNFPTAVFDRLGFLKGVLVYETRNNIKFKVRAGTEDMPEIVVVMSGDEYLLEKISLGENPIIFDLGAHIGSFSIYCSNMEGEKSRIISFEPDKNNYKLFLENLRINKINSVEPVNVAISNYNGKGYLKTNSMKTDAYYLENSVNKKKNCNVRTLYDEAKKRKIKKIDLLKMDIEGGEYALFFDKKTYDFMKRNVNYIFIEYHNMDKKNNIVSLKKLFKNHFKIIHSHKSVLTLKNTNWSRV